MANAMLDVIPDGAARTAVGSKNVYPILEVAYLLATMDGVVCDAEIVEYKNTAKMLLGSQFAAEQTIEHFVRIQAKSRQLLDLMKFYSEDEGKVRAMVHLAREAIAAIGREPIGVIRRAFAFWVGMCNSDNDYAKIERRAVAEIKRVIVSMNSSAESFVSDSFFKELEKRIVAVKKFEKETMSNSKISDTEKDEQLRGMIVEFGKMLDASESSRVALGL